MGAYNDPNAPWNEPVIPEKEFSLDVYITLKKEVNVTTDRYQPEFDEESGHTYANTDETDWKTVFEQEEFTIPQLLEELKILANKEMDASPYNSNRYRKMKKVIESCNGWETYEEQYNEV